MAPKVMTKIGLPVAGSDTKQGKESKNSSRNSQHHPATKKYIASGLKALRQWTPGMINVKQPVAQ